jgi:hypothetical protein
LYNKFFLKKAQVSLGSLLNHDPARIQALKDEPLSFFAPYLSKNVKIYAFFPPPSCFNFASHSVLENLDSIYPYLNYFKPEYKEQIKSIGYGTPEYQEGHINHLSCLRDEQLSDIEYFNKYVLNQTNTILSSRHKIDFKASL